MDDKNVDLFLNKLLLHYIKSYNLDDAITLIYNQIVEKINFFKPFLDNEIIKENSVSLKFLKQIIRKVSVDFYVYELFKISSNLTIDDKIIKIVEEIKNLNSEKEIENYFFKYNENFKHVLNEYFKFHSEDEEYVKMVIANSVNLGYDKEVFRLNNCYYNNYEDYYNYILNDKIRKGLLFVEKYTDNQSIECVNSFLNVEFDDQVEKNHFISYILSNVYAYFKINNISGDYINKLIMLTEKMTFRMTCFYDNPEFLNFIFKTYFSIYKEVKPYQFSDIRNGLKENLISTVKELDREFVSHYDIIRDANEISTISSLIENDIIEFLTLNINDGYSDEDVLNKLKNVVLGKTKIPSYSNFNQKELIINLRLLIVARFYEYVNFRYDDEDINYQILFDKIDDDIDSLEALRLFNDEEDLNLLVEKYYEYLFVSYKEDYEAKDKIVNENKLCKISKICPSIFLDYRKILGYMFPTETLETVDLTNDILGVINNIIAINLQAKVCDEKQIYSEIAQVIKHSCDDYQFTIEELTGCLICNIYERLKLKNKLTRNELDFINTVEDDYFQIEDLIDDDNQFEQIVIMFKKLNNYYLDIDSLRKIRRNTKVKGKIKVLEKYDPNYYADKAFL